MGNIHNAIKHTFQIAHPVRGDRPPQLHCKGFFSDGDFAEETLSFAKEPGSYPVAIENFRTLFIESEELACSANAFDDEVFPQTKQAIRKRDYAATDLVQDMQSVIQYHVREYCEKDAPHAHMGSVARILDLACDISRSSDESLQREGALFLSKFFASSAVVLGFHSDEMAFVFKNVIGTLSEVLTRQDAGWDGLLIRARVVGGLRACFKSFDTNAKVKELSTVHDCGLDNLDTLLGISDRLLLHEVSNELAAYTERLLKRYEEVSAFCKEEGSALDIEVNYFLEARQRLAYALDMCVATLVRIEGESSGELEGLYRDILQSDVQVTYNDLMEGDPHFAHSGVPYYTKPGARHALLGLARSNFQLASEPLKTLFVHEFAHQTRALRSRFSFEYMDTGLAEFIGDLLLFEELEEPFLNLLIGKDSFAGLKLCPSEISMTLIRDLHTFIGVASQHLNDATYTRISNFVERLA